MPRPAPPSRSAVALAAFRAPGDVRAALRRAVLLLPLMVAFAPGCAGAQRCDAMTCAPACPRDAARDASGRCACTEGTLPLLGACVSPSVGDGYCGPAAVLEAGGCAFRTCAADQRLDVVTGGCVHRSASAGAASRREPEDARDCGDAGLPLLKEGRLSCAPSDATCPRGSRRLPGIAACERSPACPAGSLPDGSGCRPIVTAGGRYGDRRVDVGAWAAIVLGFDGGSGSRDLCQPLQQDALALALPARQGPRAGVEGVDAAVATDVEISVSLIVPDQDISRVRADVHAAVAFSAPGSGAPAYLSRPDLDRRVSADVGTLVEALRGLGGEATAAAVDVRVRCTLGVVSGAAAPQHEEARRGP